MKEVKGREVVFAAAGKVSEACNVLQVASDVARANPQKDSFETRKLIFDHYCDWKKSRQAE